MLDLGTLGGPNSIAFNLNDRGQIAGDSNISFTPNSTGNLTRRSISVGSRQDDQPGHTRRHVRRHE